MIAIHVRVDKKNGIDYADLIVSGKKKIETRNNMLLKAFDGKRVGIIRTGKGKSKLVGEVTIDGMVGYFSKESWEMDRNLHLVKNDSEFDYKNKTKYGFYLKDPVKYETPVDVKWNPNTDNMIYRLV